MTTHNDQTTGTRWNGRYLTRHHWDGPDSLRDSIIRAVVTATGTDAETIAVHYGAEHSRTIEQLFGGSFAGDSQSHGLVRFLLSGAIVTVHSDGRLTVEPEDGDTTQQSVVYCRLEVVTVSKYGNRGKAKWSIENHPANASNRQYSMMVASV